jgi:hypothetical protein
MQSWTDRARRRGAISFLSFEAEMIKLGFVECEHGKRDGELHVFFHPCWRSHRFVMTCGESYSVALERLRAELEGETGNASSDTACG